MPAFPQTATADRRRGHSVLRVHFQLSAHEAPEAMFEELLGLVEDITPVYQPYPHDHSVDMDVTGALGHFGRSPHELGQILQLRALALYGVHVVVGGGRSSCSLIAAMAAAATPPGRITVIAPDDDAVGAFLRPRPVAALPGIGPATARTLSRYGITTIGQLADTYEGVLARILGKQAGRELAARARGNDDRPVQRTALIRSTSASHTFDRDELDPDAHRRALLALADELGARLRTSHEVCRGLTLTVRYADRTSTARSRALPESSAHSPALTALAYSLYTSLGLERARVRHLAMRADRLGPDETAHHQLLLDDGVDDKARRIEAVADAARSRFGPHVITAATLARPKRGGHLREQS
ncbi:DNA polymerase Y family protein [Streptomyces sp. NPDC055092]